MILKKTYRTLLLYLLVMTIVLVYSATLTAESLSWNDDSMISFVSALQKGNASVWSSLNYRPVPLTIFSYFYSFGSGSIFLFHLANILLHAVNVILLFLLLIRFQQSFPVSFLAAALFGLHPMHAGTVSWISYFPVLLSLTILLLAALTYVHYCRTNRNIYYVIVLVLGIIFHLTVNGGAQFIAVLIGIDLLENGKISKRMLYQKIPVLFIGILSVAVSKLSLMNLYYESVNFIRFGIVEGFLKVATFTRSSGITPIQDIIEKYSIAGYSLFPMLVPFILLVVFWLRKEQKILLFSFVGFLLFGLPLFTCSEGGEWMLNSEKYYLCSLFMIFAVSFYFHKYGNTIIISKIVRVAVVSLSVMTFVFISLQTYRSVTFRQTDFSFWTHVKNEFPGNVFILNKIGNYHLSRYEIGQAISYFSQAINLHPQHFESYNNRGLAYLSIYKTDSASADFSQAIAIYPQYALAYYNLSTVYSLLSEWENAVISCNKAIELQPDLVQAYNNRANTYAKQKQYVHAFADYETALRIDPQNAEIYGNRALIYLETGNVTNALWNLRKQSGLVPKRFVVLVNLGLSYILAGDSTGAFTAFSDAVRLDSANTKMYLSAVQGTFLQDHRDIALLTKIFLRVDPWRQ